MARTEAEEKKLSSYNILCITVTVFDRLTAKYAMLMTPDTQ